MKHIDIRFQFIRRIIYDNKIKLIKIDGKYNPPDVLIKLIPLISFN